MVEEINGIQILGKFNQNRIRYILQGFQDKIIPDIGGERKEGRGRLNRKVLIFCTS